MHATYFICIEVLLENQSLIKTATIMNCIIYFTRQETKERLYYDENIFLYTLQR